jgi:hypothetical protein
MRTKSVEPIVNFKTARALGFRDQSRSLTQKLSDKRCSKVCAHGRQWVGRTSTRLRSSALIQPQRMPQGKTSACGPS